MSSRQSMTKGQVEAEISSAIVSFEKEHMGRGPLEARTYIIQDMVLIRLKGVLTSAERHLAKDIEGAQLVKQVRTKLLEHSREFLEPVITDITGCRIESFHSDISTKTGERVIVVTVSENLEGKFKPSQKRVDISSI